MRVGGPSIRWTEEERLLAAALALREEVFCDEQGVPPELELDGRDSEASHLVAVDPASGEVLGTLRLLREDEAAKVGRVAVRRGFRRRGIASEMLRMALERARSEGCTRARLAAQARATRVYEGVGFAIGSEPFLEAGIEHVWMGLELAWL